MQIKRAIVVAVCSVCFGSSAPVWADIVDVTYIGTVTSGVDSASVFGSAGQNLAGFAFSANYSFDTLAGEFSRVPGEMSIDGGGFYGTASPNLSASITINGNTFSFVGDWQAAIKGSDITGFSMMQHVARNSDLTMLNMLAYDYSNMYRLSVIDPYTTPPRVRIVVAPI